MKITFLSHRIKSKYDFMQNRIKSLALTHALTQLISDSLISSNDSLTLHFSISPNKIFLLFSPLVSGVSRMGRLTAPGDGEDKYIPLQP